MVAPLEVTFLGTGASWPSPARGAAATLVQHGEDALLVDCGEGTTRQLARADADLDALDTVLLTHAHGDHLLGVPGLLWRLEHGGRQAPVSLYGPPSALRVLAAVLDAAPLEPSFPVRADAAEDGWRQPWSEHRIHARLLEHTVPSLGYALVDPPARAARLAVTGDTRPCPAGVELASGADLLVHEATYADAHAEEAKRRTHTTAREAARVAREAGAKRLALTHVSPRYEDPAPLLEQAEEEFEAVTVAEDLDQATVDE